MLRILKLLMYLDWPPGLKGYLLVNGIYSVFLYLDVENELKYIRLKDSSASLMGPYHRLLN